MSYYGGRVAGNFNKRVVSYPIHKITPTGLDAAADIVKYPTTL